MDVTFLPKVWDDNPTTVESDPPDNRIQTLFSGEVSEKQNSMVETVLKNKEMPILSGIKKMKKENNLPRKLLLGTLG